MKKPRRAVRAPGRGQPGLRSDFDELAGETVADLIAGARRCTTQNEDFDQIATAHPSLRVIRV